MDSQRRNIIMNLLATVLFVSAELLGAVIFWATKDTVKRMLLSCLGLGFACSIVITDIIPDSTENFPYAYLVVILGIASMYLASKVGKFIGKYSAVLGMGFHNFCEGVVLTAMTINPIVLIGLVLHKLPEGMVTFALLEGKKDKTRFIMSGLISLLIPLGALAPIPEEIAKPITAFAAGVILFVVSTSMINIVTEHAKNNESITSKIATMSFMGAILGTVSCLIC